MPRVRPGGPAGALSAAPPGSARGAQPARAAARPRAGTLGASAGAAVPGAVARLGGLAAAADLGVYVFAISAISGSSILQVLQGDLMAQV